MDEERRQTEKQRQTWDGLLGPAGSYTESPGGTWPVVREPEKTELRFCLASGT